MNMNLFTNIVQHEPVIHEGMKERGGGGVNRTPSIFKSIWSIDIKLGMYNKRPVYFQLTIIT